MKQGLIRVDGVAKTYPTADGATTAGLSSLCGIYIWNLLLVRLADLAADKGVQLPIFTSSHVAGGAERHADLFKHYPQHVPLL